MAPGKPWLICKYRFVSLMQGLFQALREVELCLDTEPRNHADMNMKSLFLVSVIGIEKLLSVRCPQVKAHEPQK